MKEFFDFRTILYYVKISDVLTGSSIVKRLALKALDD